MQYKSRGGKCVGSLICTAQDKYGLFDCPCCWLAAYQRSQPSVKIFWRDQLKRENPEKYEKIRLILQGDKK
jgi:hypothetical protein